MNGYDHLVVEGSLIVVAYLQIWQLADKENRGLLTPSGFGIVLRLIGHAQAGRTPSDELALQRECSQCRCVVVSPIATAISITRGVSLILWSQS